MLRLTIEPDGWHLDFSGSAKQRAASINAVAAVTRSAAYYVLRCLLPSETPTNSGLFRRIRFTLPEGSVVNARPPVAVAAGNVETSQRIVDVIWGRARPGAPHADPRRIKWHDEQPGGWGHRPVHGAFLGVLRNDRRGTRGGTGRAWDRGHAKSHDEHAQHARRRAELSYPMRVRSNRVRRGSGGRGIQRGGDGLVRCTEFLAPTTVTIISERREAAPWGLAGGAPGSPARTGTRTPGGGGACQASASSLSKRATSSASRLRVEGAGGRPRPGLVGQPVH